MDGEGKDTDDVKHCTFCDIHSMLQYIHCSYYEGRNFNSGNYLFTTDTK